MTKAEIQKTEDLSDEQILTISTIKILDKLRHDMTDLPNSADDFLTHQVRKTVDAMNQNMLKLHDLLVTEYRDRDTFPVKCDLKDTLKRVNAIKDNRSSIFLFDDIAKEFKEMVDNFNTIDEF